jgi:hypothetical protein
VQTAIFIATFQRLQALFLERRHEKDL